MENPEAFISKLKDFLLNGNVFYSEEQINKFFTRGGCYILSRILIEVFPLSELMITDTRHHCGIRYNGSVYDIGGKLDCGKYFHKPNFFERIHIKKRYGFYGYSKEAEQRFIDFVVSWYNKSLLILPIPELPQARTYLLEKECLAS